MKKYTIHIPNWHPTPLNKLIYKHWAEAMRRKEGDAQMLGAYANGAKMPKATGKRSVQIVITLGKGQRACDPDAYFKSTLDALVRLGYLKDDNKEWLQLEPIKYMRSLCEATTIHIGEVA